MHLLIDPSLITTIAIVHGNRDGGSEHDFNALRRAAKSGGYCAEKKNTSYQTLCAAGALVPTEASGAGLFEANRS